MPGAKFDEAQDDLMGYALQAYPSVYVIILNYRTYEISRLCLSSLKQLTYPRLQIIVVDNDSGDDCLQALGAEFPEILTLQTGGNLGYTGGNNRGIEQAVAAGADYVLILNPDTVSFNPFFVEEMVQYAESHPEVGIVGPRVYFQDEAEVQNTILFPPGLWRNIANWVAYRISPGSFALSGNAVAEAQVLNGVCLLIRVECLRQIGLFDENIFMYIEDADMDYRARASGWAVRYLPVDSVIHRQKREGYHLTGQVSFLLRRNSVYYLYKAGKRAEAWGYALLSLLLMAVRGVAKLNRRSVNEHFGFCRKLAAAYRQILFNRPFDESFGPPFDQQR